MSSPRAFAHKKPVGIDPRRYEATAHPMKIIAVISQSSQVHSQHSPAAMLATPECADKNQLA
jgi:hypothetical protein